LPTVVIVEDDPAAQAALAGIISARGWSVTPCGSVAEGIAAVDKGPHWLILDLKLPDGDGLAVLRHARANGRGTRTIVTTGAADPAVLRTLEAEAPDHIVMKPVVNIDEIVNLLGAP
jgi:CheY-like chemotaxis protein